jgi:glycosyltransferase involved in cell wall biosynthesis
VTDPDHLDPGARRRVQLSRERRLRHAEALARTGAHPAKLATPSGAGLAVRARRFARQFAGAPLPAKKAQVKGAIRQVLLHAGAVDAAASGVPAGRRAMLLLRHFLGAHPAVDDAIAARTGRPPGPLLSFALAAPAPWEGPLVSIVVPGGVDTEAGRQAAARQTLGRTEIVAWEPATRTLTEVEEKRRAFTLPPAVPLASALLGKYAWVVSTHTSVPAAYLALNVFALEGEQLELAFNAFGLGDDGVQALAEGRVPGLGPAELPLVVGRAELLRDDLSWSFDGLPGSRAAAVCGRVVSHPAASALVRPGEWTGRLAASSRRFAPAGRSVVAARARPPARLTHVLRPLALTAPDRGAPSRREHVLVCFPFIAVGGAEIQTLAVLRRLRDRFSFVAVTTEPVTPEVGSMLADYLEVVPAIYTLPEAIDRRLFLSAFNEIICRHGVGTLFVANGSNWIYDAAPELERHWPSLHLVNQVYDHRVGWITRYDPDLVRTFDHHIAPNPRIAEAYRRKGVDPSRISLIYPAIDTSAYRRDEGTAARVAGLRGQLGLPAGRPVVVMAGRLHPQKRPLDFLALAQRFGPGEATFLLAGDGPLTPSIDEQVGRMGLPHLRRLPFHRPLADMLALADVVVILSEYEGLPLVLLEAQALGTPVVGTDVGAIREALEWTGGGRVVPVGDPAAAERAVRAILQAPPDGRRSSERVRERFDISASARGHAAAFLA